MNNKPMYVSIWKGNQQLTMPITQSAFDSATCAAIIFKPKPKPIHGIDFLKKFCIPTLTHAINSAANLGEGQLFTTEEVMTAAANTFKFIHNTGQMEPEHNCAIVKLFPDNSFQLEATQYTP